jgi:transposase
MTMDIMIGIDLAKNVFQVHGASMTGQVIIRKRLSRLRFHKFRACLTSTTLGQIEVFS